MRSRRKGHGVIRRPALARQWAFPNSAEQLFELGELRGPQLCAPFALDAAKDVVDFCVGGVSARRKAYDARAALARRVGTDDIAETFKAPEQLVHGLFANGGALGESTWANPIRTGILEYRDMRQVQLIEAGRIELFDNAAMDGLGRRSTFRAAPSTGSITTEAGM